MIGNPKVYLHLGFVFCEGSFLHCEQDPLWDNTKAEDEPPHSYHSICGSRSFPRQVGVAEKALPLSDQGNFISRIHPEPFLPGTWSDSMLGK